MEGKGERGGEDDGEQLLHDVRRRLVRCQYIELQPRSSIASFTAPLKAPEQRIARIVTVI